MRTTLHFFLFCSLLIVNVCCKPSPYYYDLEYLQLVQLTQSNNKYACIVLTDSTYNEQIYQDRIEKANLKNKFLWDFVNIDKEKNYWYKYLIGTEKVPFTLVINHSGEVSNIVYGISRLAIQSISASDNIKEEHRNFGYKANSILRDTPCDNKFITQLIKLYTNEPDSTYENQLRHSIQTIEYPFNLYLMMKYYRENNIEDSVSYYTEALSMKLRKLEHRIIYKEIIEQYREQLFIENNVKISHLNQQSQYPINKVSSIFIRIKNLSYPEIKIDHIETSCECLKSTPIKKSTLKPFEEQTYEFKLLPVEQGHLYREIYFYSDSVNIAGSIGLNLYIK